MSQRNEFPSTISCNDESRTSWIHRLGALAALLVGVAGFGHAPDAQAQTTPPFGATECAGDRHGTNLNCTANDIVIATVSVNAINGVPGATSCINGQLITADIGLQLHDNAKNRYDIGVFIAQDGKDPTVVSSGGGSATCAVASLGIPPATDLDGDTCGDFISGATINETLTTVTIPCTAGAGGTLALNAVVTWQTNSDLVCTGPNDVYAGTASKCNANILATTINVVSLGHITVKKVTNPAGDITNSFPFTTTGIPATDPNEPSPGPTSFSLMDGGSQIVNVGSLTSTPKAFTVTEGTEPAGYSLSSLSCTLVGGGALPAGVFVQNGQTATLNLSTTTSDVECTYTNALGGTVTVTKQVVDGTPAGGEAAGATYPLTINCGAGGSTGPTAVSNGGNISVNSVPGGSTCQIIEGALPSPNTGYSYETPTIGVTGATGSACTPPAGSTACTQFTMPGGGQSVSGTVTNTLQANPGSATATKTVTGALAGLAPGSTFGITIDCGAGGTTSGTPQNGGNVTLNNITAGSTCDVYETSQATPVSGYAWDPPVVSGTGATSCAVPPAGSLGCAQFTVGPGGSISATVTNNLVVLPGDIITVTKNVTGDTNGLVAGSQFGVTVNCGAGFSATVTLTDGQSQPGPASVPGLSTCVVSEAALPAPVSGYTYGTPTVGLTGASGSACTAGQIAALPAGFTVCQQFVLPAGGSVTVTVSNPLTANAGGVTVTKSVTGAGYVAASTFGISVDCGAGGSTSGTPINGGTVSLSNVTAGSTCLISENSRPAAAAGYSYGTPTILVTGATQAACGSPPAGSLVCQQFVMPAGGSVTATVTNPTTPNPGNVVSVTKTVTGATQGYVAASTFTVDVNCGSSFPVVLTNGQSLPGPQAVPAATQCAVSETSVPAPAAGYTYGAPSITITGGTITPIVCNNLVRGQGVIPSCNFVMPPGGSVTVAVTNPLTANAGSVTVSKTVNGATAGLVAGSNFPITVNCGSPSSFNLQDGGSNPVGSIAAGTVCTVSEGAFPAPAGGGYSYSGASIAIGGATGSACATPPAGSVACQSFTMPAGGSVTATVTNTLTFIPPTTSIPTLNRLGLLALMALLLGLGAVAVPRYLRGRA